MNLSKPRKSRKTYADFSFEDRVECASEGTKFTRVRNIFPGRTREETVGAKCSTGQGDDDVQRRR